MHAANLVALYNRDHIGHQFTSTRDLPKSHGMEIWEGPFQSFDNSPSKFLARSVSHICAPGFFFTMGISMTLFALNRTQKQKWRWSQVFCHYLVRGLVLLIIEYLIDFPHSLPKLVDLLQGRDVYDWSSQETIHPGQEAKLLWRSFSGVYEVMTSLGLNMILAPLALPIFIDNPFPLLSAWLACVTCFLVTTMFIVSHQSLSEPSTDFPHYEATCGSVVEVFVRFVLFPGKLWKHWQVTIYPVFPWLGLVLLGQGFGLEIAAQGRHPKGLKAYAIGLLTLFGLIRMFGQELNFRGWGRDEPIPGDSTLMQFFLQTKYPPDLCYAAITMAVVLLLLDLFAHPTAARVAKPLLVFGRTPLFFYVVHFWLIMLLQAVFRAAGSGKFDLPYLWLVWLGVLSCMFVACRRFAAFKHTTPANSLWRML
ncbi:hypothetical protein BASA81_000559 [Batrachochytrium salamandrivorans]|nr:hypothetical protein BASA81_000559 [Batrachochytrium salamandrivorans]